MVNQAYDMDVWTKGNPLSLHQLNKMFGNKQEPFKKSVEDKQKRTTSSLKSYDEFLKMQEYFLENGGKYAIRNWAFWTVGVSVGFRVSDLITLKVKNVLNKDLTFRERICITEKKTSKFHGCLLTESVKTALTRYFDEKGWNLRGNDYVFVSQKGGGLTRKRGWEIIATAADALGIEGVIGSHTMRKTFANIALCSFATTIDMNAVATVQTMLNHSDIKTTLKYLNINSLFADDTIKSVSDFIMGKSEVKELKISKMPTNTDILKETASVKELLQSLKETIDKQQ